jgi:hypothetical protein
MPRRRGFYDPTPQPRAPAAMRPAPGAEVMVVKVESVHGATALAATLGLETASKFYRLYYANLEGPDPIPVRDIPGRGLSADRPTLLAWWARRHGAMVAA